VSAAEDERLRGLAEDVRVDFAMPDPAQVREDVLDALRAAIEPVKRQRDEAVRLLRATEANDDAMLSDELSCWDWPNERDALLATIAAEEGKEHDRE